jgi:ATP synthase protein I
MTRDNDDTDAITRKLRSKLAARDRDDRSPLVGLGMFGLVGWAVAVPTVLGIALGLWIDSWAGSARSWTLALLLAGVAVGCLNAWYWVQRESRDD